MTKEEFMGFIEEQKKSGKSEEDIVKIFCLMFRDDELNREQFEACLNAMGYGLGEEAEGLSDEELKEKVLTTSKDAEEGADVEGAKVDPDGKPVPTAQKKSPKSEEDEGDGEKEEEVEEESSSKEEDDKGETEDEEKAKAFKLFGLKN